jgi:hypothetical protein
LTRDSVNTELVGQSFTGPYLDSITVNI